MKIKKAYVLLIVPVIIAIWGFINVHSGYAVYVSDTQVGVIKKTEMVEDTLNDLLKQKSNKIGQKVFVDTSVAYEKVWLDNNQITDTTIIKNNLEKELTFKTKATAVYVEGKRQFLLPNQTDATELINNIKDLYTEEVQGKTELIEDIQFKDEEVLIEDIQTVELASKKARSGVESIMYIVKDGDTLLGIASKYNVSLDRIIQYNPGVSEVIKVGQKILISNSKPLINVKHTSTKKEMKSIPYKNVVTKTAKLPLGVSQLVQQGKTGEKIVEYEVVKINGVKTSTKVVNETIIKKPVNKVTETGNGKLLKPTSGYISSEFGQRWGKLHKGIDLANNYGANVYAAASGKVIRAGWGSGYGNIIAIQHSDGKITRYAHLSSMSVKYGVWVKRGQLIGKVGTTGRTTGPNLHFEVIKNENFKNPLQYI